MPSVYQVNGSIVVGGPVVETTPQNSKLN
jgi:hypothetical protein